MSLNHNHKGGANHYLKYYPTVFYYYRKLYRLTTSQMQVIIFFYGSPDFTQADFKNAYSLFSVSFGLAKILVKKGFLSYYHPSERSSFKKDHSKGRYRLTRKAQSMCENFYAVLEGRRGMHIDPNSMSYIDSLGTKITKKDFYTRKEILNHMRVFGQDKKGKNRANHILSEHDPDILARKREIAKAKKKQAQADKGEFMPEGMKKLKDTGEITEIIKATIVTCQWCQEEFEAKKSEDSRKSLVRWSLGRFCSDLCRKEKEASESDSHSGYDEEGSKKLDTRTKYPLVCFNCEKEYSTKNHRHRKQKFCTPECKDEFMEKTTFERDCKGCGRHLKSSLLYLTPDLYDYCSIKCKAVNEAIEKGDIKKPSTD